MKSKLLKNIVSVLLCLLIVLGSGVAAFAAAPNQAEPQTLIATENEDAIWEQIEALEGKSCCKRAALSA